MRHAAYWRSKPAKWQVSGPYFADRCWMVRNENAMYPQLTQQWFETRAKARAFAAKKRGRRALRRHRRSVEGK